MELDRIAVIGTIGYMGGIMSVPEPFAWSWAQMVEYNHFGLCAPNERVHYDRSRLALHDYARNELCGRMLGDWILMLDTDIEFEPDLAARLVRTMYANDLDVVTGLYQFKSKPHHPVLYHDHGENGRREVIGRWDRNVDLFQVDSAGAGCLLIRRRTLLRFRDELKRNPFNRDGVQGEDHSFFAQLTKLGVPAYCAWKIQVGHLMYKAVSLADQDEPDLVTGEFGVSSFAQLQQ